MMLLWLLFALMTAGVVFALLRPLARSTASTAPEAADIAVYKDQLTEIEADTARGLIQPEDAEIARREIARRLLAAAPASSPSSTQRALSPRVVAGATAALVPLAALGTYMLLGSPELPARPHAANKSAPLDKTPVADLIARVEARLASNPNDGAGWDVIAPVYFRMERYAEAANAYQRALALVGETVPRLAGFAEASVLAANGIVTEPARLAYEKIAKLEPNRIEPRFWLTLAKEQDGQRDAALADYRKMLAEAPANAPWRALVEERIAAVMGSSLPKTNSKPDAPRGPSADDVAAAGKMSDGDRAQMIRGMVEGLAKRLETNPGDAQGWLRLVQSYAVLGDRDRAAATLNEARRKLAGNPQALNDLTALAKSLGLGS